MIKLSSCCGCFSLRTGTIILGILSLIGTLIYFVLGIIGVGIGNDIGSHSQQSQQAKETMKAIGCFLIITSLVSAAIKAMLLHGVMKSKKSFMLPSIIMDFTQLSAMSLYFFAGLIDPDVMMTSVTTSVSPGMVRTNCVFMLLLTIILGGYFTLVPYSYYKELDDQAKMMAMRNPHTADPAQNTHPHLYPQFSP